MNLKHTKNDCLHSRSGIVLLVTLVLLVVLSVTGYTLTGYLSAQRHRDRYIIHYQNARYGCDSAIKYALAVVADVNTGQLIARPNEPDFSDLFNMAQEEYDQLLEDWAAEKALQAETARELAGDANDINNLFMDDIAVDTDFNDFDDSNSVTIPGPYGPPWPFVTEPVEFEIGSVKIKIEIEDENAKYPIGWALLRGKGQKREAIASLETFAEWMGLGYDQQDSLKSQLKQLDEIKTFKLDFKLTKQQQKTAKAATRRSRRGRRRSRRRTRTQTQKPATPSEHIRDFAHLFHSSLIDAEALARPTIVSETRKESALKYMAMWASTKVNINTAPRHVLEAAFTFGGDADKIAEDIIQRRRIKPFGNIEELKKELFRYSDSIEKCEEYITTVSNFLTIRITATSGVAEASAVVAIKKDGEKVQRIAVISG